MKNKIMKHQIYLLIVIFLSISLSSCTKKVGHIHGTVKDAKTGDLL